MSGSIPSRLLGMRLYGMILLRITTKGFLLKRYESALSALGTFSGYAESCPPCPTSVAEI